MLPRKPAVAQISSFPEHLPAWSPQVLGPTCLHSLPESWAHPPPATRHPAPGRQEIRCPTRGAPLQECRKRGRGREEGQGPAHSPQRTLGLPDAKPPAREARPCREAAARIPGGT